VSEVTPRSREDLAWLAGFWDGEGCVSLDKRHATPKFTLAQAGDEGRALCERVLRASGISGGVYYTPVRQGNQRPYHRVMIDGHQRVQALLAMCWPWLSSTKRAQAIRALDAHRARKRAYVHHHAAKTHCPQGHPYAGDNLRITSTPSGGQRRQCRACASANYDKRRDRANAQARERYRRKRAEVKQDEE
jgi:hypothetical protein